MLYSTSTLCAAHALLARSRAYRMCRGRSAAALVAGLVATAAAGSAFAQPPPRTGTDMELDTEALEEDKPEKPLPPPEPGAWGIGGEDEEGRFAPRGKTGALKEAEEEEEDAKENAKPADLGPPRLLSFDMVVGFGNITDVTNALNKPTKITVVSFLPGFRWRFGDTWAATLRIPFATGTIEGPAPDTSDDFKSFAMGNFELAVRPSFQITRRLRLPVGLAFAIPSAQGEFFPPPQERGVIGQALVNAAAGATRGWEENALFTSKRFGFTPNAGITFDWKALHLAADTKVEILVKAGGNAPPPPSGNEPQAELHSPVVNWVTALAGSYGFLDGKVTPGLRFWLSVGRLPVSVGTRDFSGAQAVLEPNIATRFRLNKDGSLALGGGIGYVLPLGGFLSGAGGFRIRADFWF